MWNTSSAHTLDDNIVVYINKVLASERAAAADNATALPSGSLTLVSLQHAREESLRSLKPPALHKTYEYVVHCGELAGALRLDKWENSAGKVARIEFYTRKI